MSELSQKIGRYEVVNVIGKGGMGVVYKARDPNIGRVVALKIIKPSLAEDEEMASMMKERFKREAQAAGILQHPGIVTVFDADEDNNVPFIVMEYLEGRSLEDILEDDPHALSGRAADIVAKAARALAFAHEKGIIHRDIKPANILLSSAGEVKVMDFGIAKVEGSSMTRPGTVLGSSSHMSPEQITGHPVDHRTDVFSLGVVLYQLIAGERPFLGDNYSSISYRVVRVDPVPPSQLKPALDPVYDIIIQKAMAKRPEDRYPSALDFAADLDAVMAGKPVAPPPQRDSGTALIDATMAAPAAMDAGATSISSPGAPTSAGMTSMMQSFEAGPPADQTAVRTDSGAAIAAEPPTPPQLIWQKIEPAWRAVKPKIEPALTLIHHNSYLIALLVALVGSVIGRFLSKDSAETLAWVFFSLIPLFVLSQVLKQRGIVRGLMELGSILLIPYLAAWLLGLIEGNLDTKLLRNRMEILASASLTAATFWGSLFWLASRLSFEIASMEKSEPPPEASLTVPKRMAAWIGVLRGLCANTVFWKIAGPMLLLAMGAAYLDVRFFRDALFPAAVAIGIIYAVLDSILCVKPGDSVIRVSLLIVAYFLAGFISTWIWKGLGKGVWVELFQPLLMAELIIALPTVILALLARNFKAGRQA